MAFKWKIISLVSITLVLSGGYFLCCIHYNHKRFTLKLATVTIKISDSDNVSGKAFGLPNHPGYIVIAMDSSTGIHEGYYIGNDGPIRMWELPGNCYILNQDCILLDRYIYECPFQYLNELDINVMHIGEVLNVYIQKRKYGFIMKNQAEKDYGQNLLLFHKTVTISPWPATGRLKR